MARGVKITRRKRKLEEKEQGDLVGKFPCTINEECGSSDALAVYHHIDDSYSAFCWSCQHHAVNFNFESMEKTYYNPRDKGEDMVDDSQELEKIREDYVAVDVPERKIRADRYDFYGVKHELASDGETIEKVFYPTYRMNSDGSTYNHTGYRIRARFKEWDDAVKKDPNKLGVLKNFAGKVGDTKLGISLFGAWLFSPEQHKRLFIFCGEEDAITAAHMTALKTKNKEPYACVSLPSGENLSGLKSNLEYINKFEEIYFCPDNDKVGTEFSEKALKVLPIGKTKIIRMPKGIKDPSDLWAKSANRGAAADKFWKSIWNAEKYSPVGIFGMSEGWSKYLHRGKETLIPFPDSFGDLNERTYGGYALGEIITIAAPSSVGKSSFVKEMIYKALSSTNYNIGIASFEETIDEFIEGFLSVHMSVQLNEIPYDQRDRKAEWEAFQDLLSMKALCQEIGEAAREIAAEDKYAADRIHFLDHQGSVSGEDLLDKIDFMINGLDCKIIILDPVTLALSASDMEEDDFTSEIVKTVKRNNIAWVNVHHVRKSQSGAKANSEGGDISEEDIKGSGSWLQTSMINILLMRDKVHPNPIIRNTTKIKMSKCRRHGKSTGVVGYAYYNGDTGRLEKGLSPEEILENEEMDEGMEDF